MATDIFKIKEELTENMKPKVARHLKKIILYLCPDVFSPKTQMQQRIVKMINEYLL